MRRVDVQTDDYTGFVIFDEEGKPVQAMFRMFTGIFNSGYSDGVYWLVGDVMSPAMFSFVLYAKGVDSGYITA